MHAQGEQVGWIQTQDLPAVRQQRKPLCCQAAQFMKSFIISH